MMYYVMLFLQFWPFDLATTFVIFYGLYKILMMLVRGEMDKLRAYAFGECLAFIVAKLDDNTKFEAILERVRKKVPFWLRPFITTDRLEQLIQQVYTLQAKPEAKRQGISKQTPEELPAPVNGQEMVKSESVWAPIDEVLKAIEGLVSQNKPQAELSIKPAVEINTTPPVSAPEHTNENPLSKYINL